MGVAYLDTCRGILCGMSQRRYTRSWKRERSGEKQTMRMKWEKRGKEDATHYIIVGSWHSSRARGSLIHARNSHESHEATRLRARSHGALPPHVAPKRALLRGANELLRRGFLDR